MSFQTFTILHQDEIDSLRVMLADQQFVDGRLTAGDAAGRIKNNLQFARGPGQPTDHPSSNLIDAALKRSPALAAYTLATRWVTPSFSRYDVGMQYQDHIDSAVMQSSSGPIRTDFAVTLFISSPENYEGGALVLHSPYGEEEIKLPAGQAVVYSANLLHRVEPVTRGSRLVCLTWIQSMISDERLRSISYDLQAAIQKLDPSTTDQTVLQLLNKAQQNLVRASTSF